MSRLATPLTALALAGASIALVACGSSSSGGGSAASTSTTAAAGTQSAAFQKYQACLKDNGVTLPNRGARGNGGGGGNGYGPPAGGPGAGAGGGFADNPKLAAAVKACAKLRPQGLGAGRGGPGGARGQQSIKAFTPYLDCLKAAGLDVKVADGFNALRDLERDDPKVQAALASCRSKIPQRPQASTTTPPSTSS
jgi:hypothetical protein